MCIMFINSPNLKGIQKCYITHSLLVKAKREGKKAGYGEPDNLPFFIQLIIYIY